MELKENEKTILAALSFAVVFGVYWLWTKPVLEDQKVTKTEINQLRSDISRPKYSQEDIDNLSEEVSVLNKEIETLKFQLPNSEQRGILIRDLENLARENNIDLQSFVPREAVSIAIGGQEISQRLVAQMRKSKKSIPTGKVLKTVIQIDSTGEFEDYRNFFEDIITYYRAVEVSDISISKAADPNAAGVADTRFGRGRSQNLVDSLESNRLAVAFTLNAFTAL